MGRFSKEGIVLALLFMLVLGLHVYASIQATTLSSDSYFILRQADHIKETGLPLFKDPLSYSGRTLLFHPLFYYLVALVSAFTTTVLAAKIAQGLCLAALVLVVYAIAKQVTKSKNVSLIAAVFAGFVPVFYMSLSSPSPTSLSLVLTGLLAYFYLRIEEKGYAALAVLAAILAILTSTEIFIFIFGMFFYAIILFLERNKPTAKEAELTLFLFFLAVWFNVLLFKKAFFYNGINALWGNLPESLLSVYFQELTFPELLYALGMVPLLLGVYAVYKLVFDTKNKSAHLFIGFAISSFLALWLKVVPLNSGLLFFSTSMIILSAHTMKTAALGSAKMKIPALPKILSAAVIILFFATTFWNFNMGLQEAQRQEDVAAMGWLSKNTPPGAIVLGRVEEGFMLNYYGQRKNVADSNFLFIRDSDQTYSEVESLYKLRLNSEAIRLLNKYGVNYILLSKKTMDEYNMTSLYYASAECFAVVYNSTAVVYEFKGCTI